ncbi:hypothetical protein BH10BAC1_BH10BAC1_11140 [soil metagenome]
MKQVFFFLIFLASISQMKAQTSAKASFLMNVRNNQPSYIKVNKEGHKISLKAYLTARHEYKQISKEKYSPKFSVDLLDGKGIHLFSISNIGIIPKMNVGARVTAGIKISL